MYQSIDPQNIPDSIYQQFLSPFIHLVKTPSAFRTIENIFWQVKQMGAMNLMIQEPM